MSDQATEVTTREWAHVMGQEKEASYFQAILQHIRAARSAGKTVYPPQSDLFNALRVTPFSNIQVVILGQDPYHGPDQAHGLCFSVKPGVPPPPSLVNIFKELKEDLGISRPQWGDLTPWAKQGVLLLNTVLSVEAGRAHSHANIGWERFTDAIIAAVNAHHEGVVFLLWGSHAQKKAQQVDCFKHHLLKSVHPSPLSAHRGFLGCRYFSKTNQLLLSQGKAAINWDLSAGYDES